MTARITLDVTRDGEFEIWLNEEGRDLLVRQLQHLSKKSDHFHFGPKGLAEVAVSSRAYRDSDTILERGKAMLRSDDWDARYFPHVLNGSSQ